MLSGIFNRNLVAVNPGASLQEVAQLMAKEDVGCVLVLEDRKPVGLVTDRDIVIQCLAKSHDLKTCKVEDAMAKDLEVVREQDGIFTCIRAMKAGKVRRLPVVDADGYALGVISFGDILAVLGREFAELIETTTPAFEISRKAA